MNFANKSLFAGSILAAAAFAPAQSYDVTVRTDNPGSDSRIVIQAYPQSLPPPTPESQANQRIPANVQRRTGTLGVYLSPVPRAMASQLKLQKGGLVVEGVVPGSDAERAGIQQYDVIWSVEGHAVSNPPQIERAMARHKDGEEVPVEVIREGKHLTLNVAVHHPTQSYDADGNYRPVPVPKDKQKQIDEMSEKLRTEIERQEKRIGELTDRIRAEAELARKQIQELKDQLRRDAQQQKEQILRDSRKDRDDDNSTGKPDRP